MKRIITGLLIIAAGGLAVYCAHLHDRDNGLTDRGTWVKLTEETHIGFYVMNEGKVYCCDDHEKRYLGTMEPMKGVDTATFEVCLGTNYARDKHRVYYPDPFSGQSYTTEDYCYLYYTEYVLKGAHPKAFKYLGSGYAVGGTRMYLNGEAMKWDMNVIRLLDKQHHPN